MWYVFAAHVDGDTCPISVAGAAAVDGAVVVDDIRG